MSSTDALTRRLDAEFAKAHQLVSDFQANARTAHEERQRRLAKFQFLAEQIREMAKVRLEALVARFPDVSVQVADAKFGREARLHFASKLASINLTLRVSHDEEVQNVALDYNLEILPIFIEFESHARIEQPMDQFDTDQAAAWLDDRLVAFARTYLSLGFNAAYQKGHLVTDPVAGISFPAEFAHATVERQGQTFYFICAETKQAFAREEAPARD